MNVIDSNLPIPGVFKQKQLLAEQQYEQALAALGQQQGQLFTQYGFKGNIGEDGKTTFAIDPAQEHGLALDLLRDHQSSLSNLRENLVGRGLGTRGYSARQQGLLRFMQGGETANLINRFQGAAANIYNQRAQALTNRNMAFNDAESEAVNFALQNGLFNDAAAKEDTAPKDKPTGDKDPGPGPTDPFAAGYTIPTSYLPGYDADKSMSELRAGYDKSFANNGAKVNLAGGGSIQYAPNFKPTAARGTINPPNIRSVNLAQTIGRAKIGGGLGL